MTCGRGDKATPFEFEGSVVEGFVLHFGSGAVPLNPEFLAKIKEHFHGKRVPGGFSMDNPPASGFGAWVRDYSRQWNSRALTPRHASFLAALLRDAGWLRCSYEGAAVWLEFAP
jgi:hypothetical protein